MFVGQRSPPARSVQRARPCQPGKLTWETRGKAEFWEGAEHVADQPRRGLAGYLAGLDQCGHEERPLGLDTSRRVTEDGWSDSSCRQVVADKGGPRVTWKGCQEGEWVWGAGRVNLENLYILQKS